MALHLGQEAAARGDKALARRWLDRARRLAPADDTVALSFASACVGHDDRRAMGLFERVVAANDLREAWVGLAVTRWRLGDAPGAARAMQTLLARHLLDGASALDGIAAAIARAGAAPGWCGLRPDGVLLLEVAPPATRAAIRLRLDGAMARPLGPQPHRLARGWRDATRLAVTWEGRHLLGSPIEVAALCRTEGCVWPAAGGLEGWAWHPGDPGKDPELTIRPMDGGSAVGAAALRVVGRDMDVAVSGAGVLARPRRIQVPAGRLARFAGPVAVLGADGRHLLGSPLDPRAGRPAVTAKAAPRRAVDIVIPVHGGGAATLACIDAALAGKAPRGRVVVVDDASPDPALAAALDILAARRRIRLIRNAANRGFPASANAGLAACAGRDVVLLNSDALVPVRIPGDRRQSWLERLRAAAYAAPDIGTATPLSNNATILSYPDPAGENPMPDAEGVRSLDTLAARVNGAEVVDIPTAIGFCMYLRRDCLDATGPLREDVFAQGYGEENDFCMRAAALGWRHVAATGVFVAHAGGQSFGAARTHLVARNRAVLDRLHPAYHALVATHIAADPLAPARRRMDLGRWRAASGPATRRQAALIVTHDAGGGVVRHVRTLCERESRAGRRALVLRPAPLPGGLTGVALSDGMDPDYPNLRFALPDELPALVRLLARQNPLRAELHHMFGHHQAVLEVAGRLGLRWHVHVHDAGMFCPRVGLLGPDKRYCGEPDIVACTDCIADLGRKDGRDVPVQELRRQSAGMLRAAAQVIVPCRDAAARLRRHFPAIRPLVAPHDDDAAIPAPPPARPHPDGRARVAVIGAIGLEKGYDILLACARDAARRALDLDFIVVGHTIDDARLLDTGRVFVTGEYRPEEAVALIRAQQASLAFVTSIVPETWCFTLTEAWRAELRTMAFDIGAPAERIRAAGWGWVLPLGLSVAAINNALAAASGLSRPDRVC